MSVLRGKGRADGDLVSFLRGPRSGISGERSGKSTLLRIMAGLETDFEGEARLAPGMRVRYVAQEPHLDMSKTVRENLRTAVAPIEAMVQRFNTISEQLGDEAYADKMDNLLEEMGALQDKIDACNGWETERLMAIVSDAMVLPPDDQKVDVL